MLSDFHRELQHVEENMFRIHTSYAFFQICENMTGSRGNAKMKKGESAQKTVWAAEKICRQYLMIP